MGCTSSWCNKLIKLWVIFCWILCLILLWHTLIYKARISHLDIFFSSDIHVLGLPIFLILLNSRVYYLNYLLRLFICVIYRLNWLLNYDWDIIKWLHFPFSMIFLSSSLINHICRFMYLFGKRISRWSWKNLWLMSWGK